MTRTILQAYGPLHKEYTMTTTNEHEERQGQHPAAEVAKPTRKIVYVEPKEGLHRAYANNLQAAQTIFDVRLIFGELINVTEEEIVVEQRVQITMSWPELKIVNDFLAQHIKAFEERNGQIKIPTGVANPAQPPSPEEPKHKTD